MNNTVEKFPGNWTWLVRYQIYWETLQVSQDLITWATMFNSHRTFLPCYINKPHCLTWRNATLNCTVQRYTESHCTTSQSIYIMIVRQNLGEPSNVVYSFVFSIKWKLRMSRFRICMMPPWHPWAFCAIQDGVQDGRQFKQTSRTPPLFNIEQWFWCQILCF
jgi:hypothetical protein